MAEGRTPAQRTIAKLFFQRHTHTNVYLHNTRVLHAFVGDLGAITSFERAAKTSREGGVELSAVFIKANGGGGLETSTSVTYDMEQPLAQALVLRAGVESDGRLETDVRAAPVMSYVLARGPGGIGDMIKDDDNQVAVLAAAGAPPDVTDQVLEQNLRRVKFLRADDPIPQYYPAVARTSTGHRGQRGRRPPRLALAFLGASETYPSNVVNWLDEEVTCCIFGRKLKDWDHWTMIEPFHVWLEQPEA